MNNNFVPMNMIPFIANMKCSSSTTPQPVPTPGLDTSLLPEFFVPFMDESEEDADGIVEVDEFIQLIGDYGKEQGFVELNEFLTNLKFKAKFPLSEETRDQLEDVVIYEVLANGEHDANIYYYPINDISKKYYTSIVIETNEETGKSIYVFGEIVREE